MVNIPVAVHIVEGIPVAVHVVEGPEALLSIVPDLPSVLWRYMYRDACVVGAMVGA